MRRLSDSAKIDSPDGNYLKYYTGYSVSGAIDNERHFLNDLTNTELNYKVLENVRVHDGSLFNAVGLTDNIQVFPQPVNSVLLAVKIRLDIQFAAPGMTDLDVTVGDAGDNTGILNPAAMNLTSDAVGTEYKTRGAYWAFPNPAGYCAATPIGWRAYATAVGANLSTTTAGQITLYFFYLEI